MTPGFHLDFPGRDYRRAKLAPRGQFRNTLTTVSLFCYRPVCTLLQHYSRTRSTFLCVRKLLAWLPFSAAATLHVSLSSFLPPSSYVSPPHLVHPPRTPSHTRYRVTEFSTLFTVQKICWMPDDMGFCSRGLGEMRERIS